MTKILTILKYIVQGIALSASMLTIIALVVVGLSYVMGPFGFVISLFLILGTVTYVSVRLVEDDEL